MIAITVIGVGIMGLAATANYVAMQMGGAGVQTVAASVAQRVTDSLSSRPCSALTSGSMTTRGVMVTWTVADSTRTRWVRQTVQYRTQRGAAKTMQIATVIQCPE